MSSYRNTDRRNAWCRSFWRTLCLCSYRSTARHDPDSRHWSGHYLPQLTASRNFPQHTWQSSAFRYYEKTTTGKPKFHRHLRCVHAVFHRAFCLYLSRMRFSFTTDWPRICISSCSKRQHLYNSHMITLISWY